MTFWEQANDSSIGKPPGALALFGPSPSVVPTATQRIQNLTVGGPYVVSGQYMSAGIGAASNSFGVALNGEYAFLASSPPVFWRSFSFKFVASSSNLLFGVSSQLNGTGCAYYVDNLMLQPMPCLTINRVDSNMVMSWPTNALGFSLQSATSLDATGWTAVTNVPIIVGTNYAITQPAKGIDQFFSLRR